MGLSWLSPFNISILVFLIIYIFIAFEKAHKTVLALTGAVLLVFLKVITQDELFSFIDFHTITLLISMMAIVGITRMTGVFQWLAIKAAKLAQGEPVKIMFLMSLITALLSSMLDNVTTVLVTAPITFLICEELEINPVPFLIIQAIASNIGGTATLIGDPPNIMIGSATHLSFFSFIENLAPVIVLVFIAFAYTIKFIFRKTYNVRDELKQRIMKLDESKAITNKPLFIKTMIILALILIGFFTGEHFGIGSATVALTGAAILFLITKTEPEEILKDVEWATILFFAGLFIIVGAMVKTGVISAFATLLMNLTKGEATLTTMVLLWASAFLSAILDNIPYVATMIPLVKELGRSMPIEPLWWALSLGACLGGNGTLIGASANVVIAGLAKKNGYNITFMEFTKYGFFLMIQSIIIAMIYIYLRYSVLKFY